MTEPEWRDHYNERAAIMEYDGGLTREEAQKEASRITNEALREWRRRMKQNENRDTR